MEQDVGTCWRSISVFAGSRFSRKTLSRYSRRRLKPTMVSF